MAAEEMEVALAPSSQDASTQHWVKEEMAEETRNCWSPLSLIKVEQVFLLLHECPQTERDAVNSPDGEPPAGVQWSSREQRMAVLPSPPREIQLVSPDPGSATSQVHESLGPCGPSRPVKEEVLSPRRTAPAFPRIPLPRGQGAERGLPVSLRTLQAVVAALEEHQGADAGAGGAGAVCGHPDPGAPGLGKRQ